MCFLYEVADGVFGVRGGVPTTLCASSCSSTSRLSTRHKFNGSTILVSSRLAFCADRSIAGTMIVAIEVAI